jgi:hypothetical protein
MAKDVRNDLTVPEDVACLTSVSRCADLVIASPAALTGVRANHRCCYLGTDPTCSYPASSLADVVIEPASEHVHSTQC